MTPKSFLHRFILIPYIAIAVGVLQTVVWALDRKPPFVVVSGGVTSEAVPGRPMKIEGEVVRDLSRECSARVEHWLEDGLGFRTYFSPIYISAEAMRRIAEKNPNATRYFVDLPQSVRPGKTRYMSTLLYTCNPVHLVWPIEVFFVAEFDVSEAPK